MHRDIKPGNLLLAAGGTTKITDFGIATAVRAAQASHLTETGMVMGTAMYVSPEQATGAPVTASSDIYSLGVVAYECLAGRPPFTASEPLAIAFAHKHDPVPPLPPDVPRPVADLVYDMLAKTPDGRPASMRVVADRAEMLRDALAMGAALPGGPIGATRADLTSARTSMLGQDAGRNGSGPPGPHGRLGARGRRRLVAASGTLALCGLAIAGGLYISGHLATRNTGDNGRNTTEQHLSPSPTAPSPTAAQSTTPSPQPSSLGSEQTTTAPSPTPSSKPTKTIKPTPSVKPSPSTSPSRR